MEVYTKYSKHLDILGIDYSEWKELTLPKVIKAFNDSKGVLATLNEEERMLIETRINDAYSQVRLAVLQGKNKEKNEGIEEKVSEQLGKGEKTSIDFEKMDPFIKNIRLPKTSTPIQDIGIPKEHMKEGAVFPVDVIRKDSLKLENIVIPEEKDDQEVIFYSDMIRLLGIRVNIS